jgi:hypothetical protein
MLPNEEKELGEFAAAIRRLLATGNPNPKRIDCFRFTKRIKALAWHGKPDRDLDEVLDHISHCSPCVKDHRRFKTQYRLYRRSIGIVPYAAAAVVLFLAGIQFEATWRRHSPTIATDSATGLHLSESQQGHEMAGFETPQALTLNLESNLRGEGEGKLIMADLPRGRLQLTLQLPKGAKPGRYAVRLSRRAREPLLETEGMASTDQRNDSILRINEIDTSKIIPGKYRLSLRRGSLDWVDFDVKVK